MSTPSQEPPPEYSDDEDFSRSFWLGVQLAKEAGAAGEPVPGWLRSVREGREP